MSASTATRAQASSQIVATRPNCVIDESAVIADKAVLSGPHNVKLGQDSIIQPYAKLQALGGNITIGSRCIIAEAVILDIPEAQPGEILLGDDVSIESGAHITAATIGDGAEIGIHCKIGARAVIGKFCKLAPKQIVKSNECIPDYTVLYGNGQRRLDSSLIEHEEVKEARIKGQSLHIEALRQLIPNASAKWNT